MTRLFSKVQLTKMLPNIGTVIIIVSVLLLMKEKMYESGLVALVIKLELTTIPIFTIIII